MTKIVQKFSFTLCTSNDDSTFWKKYNFDSKISVSWKKQLISKVESFLKSNFYLNQWYKMVLTQNQKNWNF